MHANIRYRCYIVSSTWYWIMHVFFRIICSLTWFMWNISLPTHTYVGGCWANASIGEMSSLLPNMWIVGTRAKAHMFFIWFVALHRYSKGFLFNLRWLAIGVFKSEPTCALILSASVIHTIMGSSHWNWIEISHFHSHYPSIRAIDLSTCDPKTARPTAASVVLQIVLGGHV